MHTVFLRKVLEVQRSRRDTYGRDHCWLAVDDARLNSKNNVAINHKPFKKHPSVVHPRSDDHNVLPSRVYLKTHDWHSDS